MRRALHAGIAHLVERHLAKVEVASSSLVARSSSEILLTAPFPPCGENCAGRGISSLSAVNHVVGFTGDFFYGGREEWFDRSGSINFAN